VVSWILPIFGLGISGAANSPLPAEMTPYEPTWASVDRHVSAPEWYQDAKFGIFFHWGAFSAQEYDHWYPRDMYMNGSATHTHHLETYGDPFTDWGYENFIEGKMDKAGNWVQFAPKLKSKGGAWDPTEYAQLAVDAGAKFGGPVMEHHDGFSMWDSKVNPWNSVDKGPKLNLAKLYVDAFRAHGLKVLAAMHHAFHFNGYYQDVPEQTDSSLKILFAQQGASLENKLWYDKLKEVIDEFQPDILYNDFDLNAVDASRRLDFLSYYYNQAMVWRKEVVVTYKDGMDENGQVFDYERGGPAELATPYWQTDDAISSPSWTYVPGMSYFSTKAVLNALIDRVSKGGNMLLSFSPRADGSIPQEQKELLLGIGAWLGVFGEAIYSTRPWSIYGEGPTKMGGSLFVDPQEGTGQDVRYTRTKDTSSVYAIFLGWPGDSCPTTTLSGLGSTSLTLDAESKVFLLGTTAGRKLNIPYIQDSAGLHLTFPHSAPYYAPAYVVRVAPRNPPTTETRARTGIRSPSSRILFMDAHLRDEGISVPAGARSATVCTPDGHVLQRERIGYNQDKIRLDGVPAGKTVVVRFER
jgi:alpha-L-fucosidase